MEEPLVVAEAVWSEVQKVAIEEGRVAPEVGSTEDATEEARLEEETEGEWTEAKAAPVVASAEEVEMAKVEEEEEDWGLS